MSGLEFADSLISSLAWPAAVVIIVVVLRARLRDLADRVEDLEGWGFKAKIGRRASAVKAEVEDLVADNANDADDGTQRPDDGKSTPAEIALTEAGEVRTAVPADPKVATGSIPAQEAPGSREEDRSGEVTTSLREQLALSHSWYRSINEYLEAVKELGQGDGPRSRFENAAIVMNAWASLDRALESAVFHANLATSGPVEAGGRGSGSTPLRRAITLERLGTLPRDSVETIDSLKGLRNSAAHAQRSFTDQVTDDYLDATLGTLELLKSGVARTIRAGRDPGFAP